MDREFRVPWDRLDPVRPPVVLLGGVSVLRSLGIAGIPVIVASPDRLEPAFASRYCTGRCRLPPLDPPGPATAALVALGKALTARVGVRVPIMYGNDAALKLVQNARESLAPYFVFLMSDPAVANALIAKDRFQAFGASCGLPVPPALSFDGDGPGSLRAERGMVLVKPKLKVDWHESGIFRSLFAGVGKARVFASAEEVLNDPVVQRFSRHLCFQKYISGSHRDLWSFHGIADEKGKVMASFAGRKIRTYPIETGESAFIELAHDEELSALGRDVAARCPLCGIFKMDFKRDPQDGRWYLLEINGRFTLWHYLGAINGVNLPALAYEHLVGGTLPKPCSHDTRFRWLALNLDFKAYRELAARGEITFLRWMSSILLSPKVCSVFAWKDPGPWLFFQLKRVRRRWRSAGRSAQNALGTLRQWLS